MPNLSRRRLLQTGIAGAAGAGAALLEQRLASGRSQQATAATPVASPPGTTPGPSASMPGMAGMGDEAGPPMGPVDTSIFDPLAYLGEFDRGKVSKLPDGRTLRRFEVTAMDRDIEIASGVRFPAWTYNGRVPGPTLRATQGDRIWIRFRNQGSMPHTMHFHGIHPGDMDGVFEWIQPGQEFTYKFDAEPFGLHLYHCHVTPLAEHIRRGLYGTFIIDPPTPRPPARELVMMMNAFDTRNNGDNDVYAVNTVAFYYMLNPIVLRRHEPVRVYLVNITEFDPINSFHLHANFFHEYPTGTSLVPSRYTDITTMGQAERSILEFTFKYPGRYMFHAHQAEFVQKGWNALFLVQ
jgi:FtsP/CotA-like multicopper oxidase with cupredoxin domain